jgi:hypothetical protein
MRRSLVASLPKGACSGFQLVRVPKSQRYDDWAWVS